MHSCVLYNSISCVRVSSIVVRASAFIIAYWCFSIARQAAYYNINVTCPAMEKHQYAIRTPLALTTIEHTRTHKIEPLITFIVIV